MVARLMRWRSARIISAHNHYLPGDLERQIDAFVEYYNHVRYHESINNLTPANVYFGTFSTDLKERLSSALGLSQIRVPELPAVPQSGRWIAADLGVALKPPQAFAVLSETSSVHLFDLR
jgi:hypothetical protein